MSLIQTIPFSYEIKPTFTKLYMGVIVETFGNVLIYRRVGTV